jgi:hypothetical protein
LWARLSEWLVPPPVELANLLVERMGEHAEAPDVAGGAQSRRQRE